MGTQPRRSQEEGLAVAMGDIDPAFQSLVDEGGDNLRGLWRVEKLELRQCQKVRRASSMRAIAISILTRIPTSSMFTSGLDLSAVLMSRQWLPLRLWNSTTSLAAFLFSTVRFRVSNRRASRISSQTGS